MTLPFCHVCRWTYRVAAGFLFSGDVLDDWKETWSDLRDTTCRRFIISFSLFLFFELLVSSVGLSSWGAEGGGTKGFRRIVVTGLSLCFLSVCPLLIASTGGVFLRVLVFWSGGMPAEVTLSEAASERSARGTTSMGGVGGGGEKGGGGGGGGGGGKWFWLGSDLRSSVRDCRWVYKHMGGGPIGISGYG